VPIQGKTVRSRYSAIGLVRTIEPTVDSIVLLKVLGVLSREVGKTLSMRNAGLKARHVHEPSDFAEPVVVLLVALMPGSATCTPPE
jgi:hypothetical protein